jgi:hypothetical protein
MATAAVLRFITVTGDQMKFLNILKTAPRKRDDLSGNTAVMSLGS